MNMIRVLRGLSILIANFMLLALQKNLSCILPIHFSVLYTSLYWCFYWTRYETSVFVMFVTSVKFDNNNNNAILPIAMITKSTIIMLSCHLSAELWGYASNQRDLSWYCCRLCIVSTCGKLWQTAMVPSVAVSNLWQTAMVPLVAVFIVLHLEATDPDLPSIRQDDDDNSN